MYKKFQEFSNERSNEEFNQKIDELCFEICLSGETFDEWWTNKGLPTILSEGYSTEDELLNELSFNPMNWFNKPDHLRQSINKYAGSQPPQAAPMNGANQGPAQMPNQLSTDAQVKIKAAVSSIKQQLGNAMHGVIEGMKKDRNSVGFQVANLISQRLGNMLNNQFDNLKWKRGEGKFNHDAAFGPANTNRPETKDRYIDMAAQKLGTTPDKIKYLIQAGFKRPDQWKWVLANQQGGNPQNAVVPFRPNQNSATAAMNKF